MAVRHLRPNDFFSVVAFADDAQTIIPLQQADPALKPVFLQAIARIRGDNGTNLTAGYMLGRDAVREAPADANRRVLLLTDGQLNTGIKDPATVRRIVSAGLEN
jgi:secreted protein with Ig-like and vWFA domain